MSFKKIRIRDDDVLVESSGRRGTEFARFKGFHNIVCLDERHFIHVPAILVTEIQAFPECIDFIRYETANGKMEPEVHGLHHIDYAALSMDEVTAHLIEAKQWIKDNLRWEPTIWYSPHGAGADVRGAHLSVAAHDAGLKLITCEKMIKPSALVYDVRAVKGTDKETGLHPATPTMRLDELLIKWEGKEILRHWWEGIGALTESIKFFKENV